MFTDQKTMLKEQIREFIRNKKRPRLKATWETTNHWQSISNEPEVIESMSKALANEIEKEFARGVREFGNH
jgi:hypothetical protein